MIYGIKQIFGIGMIIPLIPKIPYIKVQTIFFNFQRTVISRAHDQVLGKMDFRLLILEKEFSVRLFQTLETQTLETQTLETQTLETQTLELRL